MRKYFWIYSFLLAIVLNSCKSSVQINNSLSKEIELRVLEGTYWKLADETGTKLPTLLIENKKISGNATCNNYTGVLEMDFEGNFIVKNIATTRMACKKDTEAYFLGVLRKVNRYKATTKKLELYQNDLLLLKFNRIN